MFDSNDDVKCDDRRSAFPTDAVRRRRWSAAERTAVIRETLVPGARVSEVARRWQMDPQQVYRWRHSEGVTQRRPMQSNHAPAPTFVPILTNVMPTGEAVPATSSNPVIEVRLAGAVVRVVPGTDDAPLTAVLRAVRASASRT
jgi:transposase